MAPFLVIGSTSPEKVNIVQGKLIYFLSPNQNKGEIIESKPNLLESQLLFLRKELLVRKLS
jgi:hypothetical protein